MLMGIYIPHTLWGIYKEVYVVVVCVLAVHVQCNGTLLTLKMNKHYNYYTKVIDIPHAQMLLKYNYSYVSVLLHSS